MYDDPGNYNTVQQSVRYIEAARGVHVEPEGEFMPN